MADGIRRYICALRYAFRIWVRCGLPPALRATPLINAGGEGAVGLADGIRRYILHSTLHTSHSTLHTPHSTPSSALFLFFCCKILGLAL